VELGGKTISVEVEFIDEPLNYNIIMGHTWVYAMVAFVSTYFQMFSFPHKGGIVSKTNPTYLPLIPMLQEVSLL